MTSSDISVRIQKSAPPSNKRSIKKAIAFVEENKKRIIVESAPPIISLERRLCGFPLHKKNMFLEQEYQFGKILVGIEYGNYSTLKSPDFHLNIRMNKVSKHYNIQLISAYFHTNLSSNPHSGAAIHYFHAEENTTISKGDVRQGFYALLEKLPPPERIGTSLIASNNSGMIVASRKNNESFRDIKIDVEKTLENISEIFITPLSTENPINTIYQGLVQGNYFHLTSV